MSTPRIIVLACLAIASVAEAQLHNEPNTNHFEYRTHGSSCQPAYGQSSNAAYGEPGVGNFSTTDNLRVFCPVPATQDWASFPGFLENIEITGAALMYDDESTDTPFWCYVWVVDAYGAQWWTPVEYTCSAGGCPDSTSETTGMRYIHWYPPFGTTQFFGPHVGYSCSVPPTGSSGTSWVSQAYTFTQEWTANFAP